MPLLSVVIPVYNVEDYIEKCIESLLNQSLKDIELIFVDDGSIDNSGAICDSYAEKNNNITVVHKKNGGATSAIIAGVDVASSDVIGFCDSDDHVSANYYETLYNKFVETDVDLVACKLKITYDTDDNSYNTDDGFEIVESNQILDEFWEKDANLSVGNNRYTKLFKKDLLLQVFSDTEMNIRIGEDAIQVISYLEKCKKVCVLNNFNGYFYLQRSNSVMNDFSKKHFEYYLDYINALKKLALKNEREFKSLIIIQDSLMSHLLYKCFESDIPFKSKISLAKQITTNMSNRKNTLQENLSSLNPILKFGFCLIDKGLFYVGAIYISLCLTLIKNGEND